MKQRHDLAGLVELSRRLASADPRNRQQALRALRTDTMLRDEVRLVAITVDTVEAHGGSQPERAARPHAAELRAVAAIIPRLREMLEEPDPKVRRQVKGLLEEMEKPPP